MKASGGGSVSRAGESTDAAAFSRAFYRWDGPGIKLVDRKIDRAEPIGQN